METNNNTNIELLDKIIGLCYNRCDEIPNKNCSIDYHMFRIIRETAESIRMNITDENTILEKSENTKSDYSKSDISQGVNDILYRTWQFECPQEFEIIANAITDKGIDKLKPEDFKHGEFMYKVAEEIEYNQYESYKFYHNNEYKEIKRNLYTSGFNIKDYSEDGQKWLSRIEKEVQDHYNNFGL